MRPNFPPQMAQRVAALFRGYWVPLSTFASCSPRLGSAWRAPLVRRRISHTREVRHQDRSGLPGLAACRDTARRAWTLMCRLPR